MRKLVVLFIWGVFIFAGTTFSDTLTQNATHPNNWLTQTALKVGFVASYSAAQSVSGLVEGYSFGGRNVVGEDTYHVFRAGRDLAWASTGYMGYATITNKNQSNWGKARRILGTALIGRDAFEWSYRAQRYGNPFDYAEEKNRHSIVYIGFRNGKLVDCYIGTGSKTGPLVDMGFLATGIWLLGWE